MFASHPLLIGGPLAFSSTKWPMGVCVCTCMFVGVGVCVCVNRLVFPRVGVCMRVRRDWLIRVSVRVRINWWTFGILVYEMAYVCVSVHVYVRGG